MVEVVVLPPLRSTTHFLKDDSDGHPSEGAPDGPREGLARLLRPKEEREAERAAKREEAERKLREQLGIDSPPNSGEASGEGARAENNLDFGLPADPSSVGATPIRYTAFTKPGGSRPRVSLQGGPSRPPKPKPHRHIVLGGSDHPEVLSEEKRWRSALLPLWPDRTTGAEEAQEPSPRKRTPPANDPPQTLGPDVRPRTAAPVMVSEPSSHQNLPSEPEATAQAQVTQEGRVQRNESPRLATKLNIKKLDEDGGAAAKVEVEVLGECSASSSVSPTIAPTSPSTSMTGAGDATCSRPSSSGAPTSLQSSGRLHQTGPSIFSNFSTTLAADAARAETSRRLEESARRLREERDRVRAQNRRFRLFGTAAIGQPTGCGTADASGAAASASNDRTSAQGPDKDRREAEAGSDDDSETSSPSRDPHKRRLQELRERIEQLDAINAAERRKLEQEQQAAQRRQEEQESFERSLQATTEMELQRLHEQGVREEMQCAEREEALRRALEDRTKRREQQQLQEEQQSKRLEERRKEGRSEKEQLKWQLFEEELERQWAEQEQEERRRLEAYARERRRLYEDWDKRLTTERQRLATEAEFCAAARHCKARSAAEADESFYGPRRRGAATGNSSNGGTSAPGHGGPAPHPPQAPPPSGAAGPKRPVGAATTTGKVLDPDECSILKELQSVRTADRGVQKAKVKDLLFRWHPDKNPNCQDKAKRLFQFVQAHRQLVLGL
mmetsp:Transcript_10086/g.22314  ORF Transcript_10086/g.22314 Transcript_10086/m.22314 type:complete len:729 (-) Transcript_10086:59-2245(-)